MIILKGNWSSKVEYQLYGTIEINIITNLSTLICGHYSGLATFKQNKSDSYQTNFLVDIEHERIMEYIDGKKSEISRLFIREKHLRPNTYHTIQLTSYDKGKWFGTYTSIYPGDYGQLSEITQSSINDPAQISDSESESDDLDDDDYGKEPTDLNNVNNVNDLNDLNDANHANNVNNVNDVDINVDEFTRQLQEQSKKIDTLLKNINRLKDDFSEFKE